MSLWFPTLAPGKRRKDGARSVCDLSEREQRQEQPQILPPRSAPWARTAPVRKTRHCVGAVMVGRIAAGKLGPGWPAGGWAFVVSDPCATKQAQRGGRDGLG